MIQELMKEIAYKLAGRGWILRSGHAEGADQAFERGADYWYVKNGREARPPKEIFFSKDASLHSMGIARDCFKEQGLLDLWQGRLTSYVRGLHGRNIMQILGRECNKPVEIVVCWTPDGCEDGSRITQFTGGTRTAIWCAWKNNIPVINLYHKSRIQEIRRKLKI